MKINEEWRDVPGYEGLYQVSNLGRVKNRHNLIMKQRKDKDGYCVIILSVNGKQKYTGVHRLVAAAFCYNSDPVNYDQVNHKDKNTSNNCADNLEWCDCQYNIDYSRSHQVAQIDLNSGHIIRVFVSVRAAARFLKKSKTAILEVADYLTYGKLNQHKSKRAQAYGYAWRYI